MRKLKAWRWPVWPKHVAWYSYQINKSALTGWSYIKLFWAVRTILCPCFETPAHGTCNESIEPRLGLLGYDAVLFGRYVPLFWRNLLPQSLCCKVENIILLWTIQREDLKVCTRFIWLIVGHVIQCWECSNWRFDSAQWRAWLDYVQCKWAL